MVDLPNLINRVLYVGEEMRALGLDMNVFGTCNEMRNHGLELFRAGVMMDEWLENMECELRKRDGFEEEGEHGKMG